MRKIYSKISLILTLLVLAGVVGWFVWFSETERAREKKAQMVVDPTAPLAMPLHEKYDPRFNFLSPWEENQIPTAVRFDPPLGSEHAALIYNAQKFWEMNEKRGGHHTGDDLNGIGGMNTDLGDPVFSVADGLVVFAAESSPGWGNIIVIAHRTTTGEVVHSMYAHLERIDVQRGALVARGEKIGTVGTANGYYPAHLHFEMRASDGVDIGAGYAMYPLNRLDPMGTVAKLRNAGDEMLSKSPLGLILKESGE
ncbi:M23 family metallopeptidase [Luteolibacter pohnpeiensis]|uniref:M23 family metallopeptidase n=1 Tax=Luteolibacter pohnpeiensis TaxID=454153 RepID=A0A934SDL7_9BACT|nr:M23 family metallopeptidase [Luteolibacter pohnpeiensis]MBK1884187.1 M23 family metallopeptidase [Luteolibacter pohnpeiensis]